MKTYVFLLLCCLASKSCAQLACNGLLNSPPVITSDVLVSGVACTISGVQITGSVQVTSGGSLTTTGTVSIVGGIGATDSGDINLGGTLSVSGGVSVTGGSAIVRLLSSATVTSLNVEGGARAVVRGTTGGLVARSAGAITIRDGTVQGGGVFVEQGTASLLMCGANVAGGVSVIGTTGDVLIVPSTGCAGSAITGSILVNNGNGDVRLGGAGLAGSDLNVIQQTGAIIASNAAFSDISIEKTTGDVTLSAITTDSDGSLIEINGAVLLEDSVLTGDFSVNGATAARIEGNNFSNESFSVSAITGLVNVQGNVQFSASVIENTGAVTFIANNAAVASIVGNTGGVTITGNNIITLSCSNNIPPPIDGGGNIISGVASGQCAAF